MHGCDVQLNDYLNNDSSILNELIGDAATNISNECIDNDFDGYGNGCSKGFDCDDYDPFVNPEINEYCDGIDNNCNGIVDEGTEKGDPCIFGYPGCEIQGHIECNGFQQICVSNNNVFEVCNGVDDDCDNEIDEDNPDGGGECDTGDLGECNKGIWTCVVCSPEDVGCIGGSLGCIPIIQVGTQEEVCNGIDDDCDGLVDEGADNNPLTSTCYTGPSGTSGDGLCHDGQWSCIDGKWGPCMGQVRPTNEICDGEDNDCDGEIDEGFSLNPEDCVCNSIVDIQRDCYTGNPLTNGIGICQSGISSCIDNADPTSDTWGICVGEILPIDEICDDVDNDCDGEIDEDFGINEICSVGTGACRVNGVKTCGLEGVVVCNAIPNLPNPELCNHLDDDCDGIVDDVDNYGASCDVGLGICQRFGVLDCDYESGQLKCSIDPGLPQDELCDGIDNDCDGSIDNGFTIGEVCTVGVGACERSGIYQCSFDGTMVCNVQPGGPGVEICDGIDNDCDDQIDEGFGVGNFCVGEGQCGEGTVQCKLGNSICSTTPGGNDDMSSDEICDGIDNDCDGEIDENFYESLGEACVDGCGNGIYECSSNPNITWPVCSTSQNGSVAQLEICDGIDNDCDYSIDEGFDIDGDMIADCFDDDMDGDGSLNVDDCAPTDPAIYTGCP